MNCPSCEKVLPGTVLFCPHCGYRLQAVLAFDNHLQRLLQGQYAIQGRIGKGGMALVYEARDLTLDRRVALKVLLPEYADREELGARFLQEARLAAQLDYHPNVVRIFGIHQSAEVTYFTMSLLTGGTLAARIDTRGRLPADEALAVARQVASALRHAHERGIIHRDIKPENILFDAQGAAVVSDFGIAKAPSAAGLTQPGMVLGTPLYMSPEQIRGEELTPASDLYSFGVVIYHMLTGTPPFMGKDGPAVMHRHLTEAPAAPHDLFPDIPAPLSELVIRMLIKVPPRRVRSAGELLEALHALRGGAADSHPEPEPASPEPLAETAKTPLPMPAARPRSLLWTAGIVLALLGAGAGWVLISSGPGAGSAVPPEFNLYQQQLPQLAGLSAPERIVFLERVLQQYPRDASVLAALAGLYHEDGEFTKAGDSYRRVLEIEPDNVNARADWATVLYQLRQTDDAIGQLEAVLRAAPNHPKALYNLGLLLAHEKKDPRRAAARWQQLVTSNPQSPYARLAAEKLAGTASRP